MTTIITWLFVLVYRGGLAAFFAWAAYRCGKRNTPGAHTAVLLLVCACALLALIQMVGYSQATPARAIPNIVPAWLLGSLTLNIVPVLIGWYLGMGKRRASIALSLGVLVLAGTAICLGTMLTRMNREHDYYTALTKGDLQRLEQVLEHGAKVNAPLNHRLPLYTAWEHGHLDVVDRLIDAGADVNAGTAGYGRNVLHHAVAAGNPDHVRFLLDRGAQWDDMPTKQNPIFTAIRGGDERIVELLLDYGDPENLESRNSRSLLTSVGVSNAHYGHVRILRLLEARGIAMAGETFPGVQDIADPRIRQYFLRAAFTHGRIGGQSPYWELRGSGYPSQTLSVLQDNPERKGTSGTTDVHEDLMKIVGEREVPGISQVSFEEDYIGFLGIGFLHAAARQNNGRLAESILNKKGDPNLRSKLGETPLHIAARWNHTEMVTRLVRRGASIYMQNDFGETPLHTAMRNGSTNVARQLLDLGADPDVMDCWGQAAATPHLDETVTSADLYELNRLIKTEDTDGLAAKLDAGLDPSALTGISLLHAAVENRKEDVLAMLLDRGLPVDLRWGKENDTALHLAVRKDYQELVHMLLEHGANLEARNFSGETPLLLAATKASSSTITYLCRRGADASVSKLARHRFGELLYHTPLISYLKRSRQPDEDTIRSLEDAGADRREDLIRAVHYLDTDSVKALVKGNPDKALLTEALHKAFDPTPYYLHRDSILNWFVTQITKALVDAGADPDNISFGNTESSPLLRALKRRNLEAAQALLEAGADISGNTVNLTDLVLNPCNKRMARLLLDHGLFPDPSTDSGVSFIEWISGIDDPCAQEIAELFKAAMEKYTFRCKIGIQIRGKATLTAAFTFTPPPEPWASIYTPEVAGEPDAYYEVRILSQISPDKATTAQMYATIIPRPEPGWEFDHWEGDLPPDANPETPELTLPAEPASIVCILRKSE